MCGCVFLLLLLLLLLLFHFCLVLFPSYLRDHLLKSVPARVVVEGQIAIITPAGDHTVLVHTERVDHGLRMLQKVMQVSSLWKRELFDIIGRPGHETELLRMQRDASDTLFMEGQRGRGFPRANIPEADRGVLRPRHDLRICRLRGHGAHEAFVAAQGVDLGAGAHIPHATGGVTPAGEEHVQGRVLGGWGWGWGWGRGGVEGEKGADVGRARARCSVCAGVPSCRLHVDRTRMRTL